MQWGLCPPVQVVLAGIGPGVGGPSCTGPWGVWTFMYWSLGCVALHALAPGWVDLCM